MKGRSVGGSERWKTLVKRILKKTHQTDKTEIVAPLAAFQTSYNKGSQPANLEGNSAHIIGGWFQHNPKGNAFKDPYVCLAPNQVLLNNTVFSYTTNLLTIHFIWELICLIAILLMFILVYCNENSIFQTMNKCIPVVLQWLNQSTGSTSRREFIQYVHFSVLLMPNIVRGFHYEDGTCFCHQQSWSKSLREPCGEHEASRTMGNSRLGSLLGPKMTSKYWKTKYSELVEWSITQGSHFSWHYRNYEGHHLTAVSTKC